ncbi:Fic family protein [Mediterraneibacter glycyrrhizinilyticus]|nr:Fic family protein [Mediterraneibacter glycyrrhizinilyticus]MBM6854715.1 Fic family protein [Mediterraneibacter glycyrrhizinilyticus]
MDRFIYITPEQAKITHEKTIQYSGGGTLEELDFGKLESVLYNIQNDDWYPTFVDKLTHLFFCTCQFHSFADGNKRLAITLSTLFLLLNGYLSIAETFLAKTENISLNVAASKIDKELLHKIMEAILNGSYDEDEALKLEIYNAINREL